MSVLGLNKVRDVITQGGKYSIASNANQQTFPMLVMMNRDMQRFWPALHKGISWGRAK
jgi:hypothetical protein